jgi:hypothetical protein
VRRQHAGVDTMLLGCATDAARMRSSSSARRSGRRWVSQPCRRCWWSRSRSSCHSRPLSTRLPRRP